ncbi:MAG TPA: hypothetical protein VFC69_02575 [Dysgonamonadaceae bacterium]|nr:hypothetical protein [Dysgonamonadaceae bacterium]
MIYKRYRGDIEEIEPILVFKQRLYTIDKSYTVRYRSYLDKVKDDFKKGKTHRVLAKSNSMRPFIVGLRDELTLQQTNKQSFKKGSILLAELGGLNHVVHRLVNIEGKDLLLRSDANFDCTEMCKINDIIAEVVAVKRKGKIVRKGSFSWGYYRYLSYFIQAFNTMQM